MATTIPIPLTTISAAVTAGPATIPAGVTQVALTVNRNVGATPIDTLLDASTTVVTISAESSADGGSTWTLDVSATVPGGQIIPTRGPNAGVEQVTSGVRVDGLVPGQQARARIVPAVTFTTSGSLVLS